LLVVFEATQELHIADRDQIAGGDYPPPSSLSSRAIRWKRGSSYLAGAIGLGNERKLDLAVRLGWMHEFADVARPITAAFAGAPGNSFTVFGATPLRNAAVVGLPATTTIAAATQIYLRYDGEIATGTDNHALNVGVRMSW
jgi:outer membrane autotransporter protein